MLVSSYMLREKRCVVGFVSVGTVHGKAWGQRQEIDDVDKARNRCWYHHRGINGGVLLADTIAVINAHQQGDSNLVLSCIV